MAENKGFEPLLDFSSTVFETAAIDRTLPIFLNIQNHKLGGRLNIRNPSLAAPSVFKAAPAPSWLAFLKTYTTKYWSAWRGSNSRHPAPKAGALPAALHAVKSNHGAAFW